MDQNFTLTLAARISIAVALAAAAGCGDEAGSAAAEPEIPIEFVTACDAARSACNVRTAPPAIAGSYTGTGQTVVTTSELWNVGSSESFSATVVDVGSGFVSGTFTMESFELVVETAEIRGSGTDFTIYGIDTVETDEGCSLEARAVITGTASDAATPATLTGELTLVFTENVSGAGCTPEQIADYPGTGASFSYTATRQ